MVKFFCCLEINYFLLYQKDYITIQKCQSRPNSGISGRNIPFQHTCTLSFQGHSGIRCESLPFFPDTLTTLFQSSLHHLLSQKMCLSSQIKPKGAKNSGHWLKLAFTGIYGNLIRITPVHGLGTLPLPESRCPFPLSL